MPSVESKRVGDAKDRRWRAELAKQVLGFANRDPEVASTWFGGCAWVLVGVALNGSTVCCGACHTCHRPRSESPKRAALTPK